MSAGQLSTAKQIPAEIWQSDVVEIQGERMGKRGSNPQCLRLTSPLLNFDNTPSLSNLSLLPLATLHSVSTFFPYSEMPTLAISHQLDQGVRSMLAAQKETALPPSSRSVLELRSSLSGLISSSSRQSPHFLHGNSPLLVSQSFDPPLSSPSADSLSSPGQFDDAEELSASPSSLSLQEQLRSASEAVEELKKAVNQQRRKRVSLLMETIKILPTSTIDGEMPTWQSDQSDPLPKGKTDGAGLGLNIPVEELLGRPHERKTNTLPRASPAISLPKQPVRGQHYRRHWLSKNNDDCSNSTVSKAWTTAFYTLPSPRLASASATLTSAPTTPKLDSEMPSTPIITSSAVLTSSTSAATTYTFHQDGRDASNTASSSFKPNNTAVAVTAVSTAGSLLLLAGLFFALYLRRRRSKRDHQNKMTSVLDKVSSNPRNDPKSSDGRQRSEKWANCGRGAVDSNEYFIAAANQATTPASVSDAKKLKFISPWLVYDLGSHPFANAGRAQTGAERRFSPDLAHSGLVGQSPSKDQSFTWSFPKLSVPPAAARAIVTSHYIKKKRSMTLPPPPVCDSRSISSVDIQQAATNSSSPSSIGHRRSFLNMEDAKIRNVSTSASSDCVDPQVDHRRMSFTVIETVKDSKRWIRSALRCLESQKLRPEIVVENLDKSSCNSSPWLPTISSRRSTSLRSGSHSISFLSHMDDSATMQVEQITSTSRPEVGNVGVRLPSLSVVNNVMLDALDISSIPFPTPPVKGSPRLSSLKWARRSSGIDDEASKIQSGMTTTAVRSFSNESYQPHIAPPTRIVTRRVSWAGLLEACREDSKENMAAMSHEAESATLPLANSEIATNTMLIRRPCDWGNALLLPADTEDEGSNGYEAEQEVDTEVETDDSRGRVYVPPSTPVITLTCSEEEGNLERRISLTSARRESSSESSHQACQAAQHEVDDDDEDATLFDRDAVDLTNSSGDELTVILNSFDSSIGSESSGNEDDDDNGDDGGALHCLLHDDFPTIPQWTPIPSALRNR